MKQKENRKKKKGWIKVLIILAIPVLLIGGLRIKNTIWPPESEGIDYAKALSLQSQASESSELADVEKRTLEVKYINKEEKVETRSLILYVPKNAEGKIPLIYIPHYEIEKDSAELRLAIFRIGVLFGYLIYWNKNIGCEMIDYYWTAEASS